MNFHFKNTEDFNLRVCTVFITVGLLLGLNTGCSRSTKPTNDLRYGSEEVVGKIGETNIVVETWYAGAIMGLPVRRVCLKKGTTNSEVLFTAEKEFQEAIPGYPTFVSTNGAGFIQDQTESYIFSIADRRFVTNYWSNLVYVGDYRRGSR